MSIRAIWLVLLGSLLSAAILPAGGGAGPLCRASQPAATTAQANATSAPSEAATQPAATSAPSGEGDGHDLVKELFAGDAIEEHIRFLVACGESFDFALDPQSGTAPAGESEELSKAAFEENRRHHQPFARRFDRWDRIALFAREANGPITWDEAFRYRTALRKALLAAYDADHDGQLTGEERAAANQALAEGKLLPLKPDKAGKADGHEKADGHDKADKPAPGASGPRDTSAPAGAAQDANAPREATQAPDATQFPEEAQAPDESEQGEASEVLGAPDAAVQPDGFDSDGWAPENSEG